MGMHLEVLLQIVDALGENRNLDFRRTGVGVVEPVSDNDFVLFLTYASPHLIFAPACLFARQQGHLLCLSKGQAKLRLAAYSRKP